MKRRWGVWAFWWFVVAVLLGLALTVALEVKRLHRQEVQMGLLAAGSSATSGNAAKAEGK